MGEIYQILQKADENYDIKVAYLTPKNTIVLKNLWKS